MTRPDDHLAALFALDLPPSSDPAFSAEVLEAMTRRRLWRDLAVAGGASLAGAVALALLWPVLQPALSALAQGLAPAGLALGAAALVVALTSRRVAAGLRFQ